MPAMFAKSILFASAHRIYSLRLWRIRSLSSMTKESAHTTAGGFPMNTKEIRNIYGKLQSPIYWEDSHVNAEASEQGLTAHTASHRRSSILHELAWQELMVQLNGPDTIPLMQSNLKHTSCNRRTVRRNVSWEDQSPAHQGKSQAAARQNTSMTDLSSASVGVDAGLPRILASRPPSTLQSASPWTRVALAQSAEAKSGGESAGQMRRAAGYPTCTARAAGAVVGALRRVFKSRG